jgi:uncharacterized protein (TIGR02118 family)
MMMTVDIARTLAVSERLVPVTYDRGEPDPGGEPMTKLVVLYGPPQDTEAFDAHYTGTHAPLVEKVPGLRRFEHGRFIAAVDGSPAPYYYMAELYFDDAAALTAGLDSPEGQASGEDVANLAGGGVTMLVAES